VPYGGDGECLVFDHFLQPCQHRNARFLLHQLRVVDLAVGVIQNHQQVIPALVLKPAMLAAEKLQEEHQVEISYSWVKGLLQGAGMVAKGRKRGVHRKLRPRRPLPGMLLHIDDS
jgi:hypothetical protein